jgi:hypothetical protein
VSPSPPLVEPPGRPQRRLPAALALAALALAASVAVALVVLDGDAGATGVEPGTSPKAEAAADAQAAAAAEPVGLLLPDEPGLCIELTRAALPVEAWPGLISAVVAAAQARPDLFPEPALLAVPDLASGAPAVAEALRIGVWSATAPADSAMADRRIRLETASCLTTGAAWSARVTLDLLRAGADRRASAVRLSPGTSAKVDVSFHPAESRVRTFLDFELPLGIGGICWLDDVLSMDAPGGVATAASSTGMDVTPFAEYGCERFMALMPDGGAGEQAVSLVPTQVIHEGEPTRVLRAGQVRVEDAVIVVDGAPAP